MNENQIADIWMLVKEYVDKKAIEALAERYVDLLADHGIPDKVFRQAQGFDDSLDEAIDYYLDQDSTDEPEDEDNWDFDEADE